MADSQSQPPPPVLGRYRVIRRLGAGGMAEVFLAKLAGAEGIDKVLVVKRVLPSFARSAKFRAMFLDEAKVATRLNHPNVVQVFSFEQIKDDFLLAMEFVDGLDLGRLGAAAKRAGTRISHGLAAFVVAEASKGLDYAHNRKDEQGKPLDIVHRDVSPQNVLVSFEGAVKIADFGIAHAKLVSEETGVIKGKFAYMSPEQARGEKVDRRSDVYSLGVLLAELLMGRVMYPGMQGLDLLEQVREGKIILPRAVDASVPEELERIVKKATEPDRELRYQTARALGTALTQWLHGAEDMWDGAALEELITRIAPRETTSVEGPRRAKDGQAAVTAVTVPGAQPGEREHRERRHVVVVAGVMRSTDLTSPGADETSPGAPDSVARVLADIAFKHDAVLRWRDDAGERRRFRVVLGVGRASVQEPLRAVRLALDVVEAMQGLGADLLVPVGVSLGISRGMATIARATDGRLLRAEPVGGLYEIAERLAASARPFEVLAAGDVYRVSRRDFVFDESASREMPLPTTTDDDSQARTVRAYPVRGMRVQRGDDARTEAGSDLVGRVAELASLRETYGESASSKKSAFVAVTGELGIGKTALLDAAFASLSPRPRTLRVECAFGLAEVPFAAAADLVREAFAVPRGAPEDDVRQRLTSEIDALVPKPEDKPLILETLLPLLAPSVRAVQPRDGDERASAVLRSVRTVLGAMAARAPLALRVDALQWADPESLTLLAALMRRTYELPLFVALASRPEARVDAALAGVPRLELGELDAAGRSALVRAKFGGAEVPADVEQAIVERAGGNPFFVQELVEAMIERQIVAITPDHRVVRRPGPITLPTTLEGAIAARLADLPTPERHALRWLAAAGPGLRTSELSGASGDELGAAIDSLVARGVVVAKEDGTLAIESAVVRHVAYESADPEDRRRMHRRIAAQLAEGQVGAPPARIARHLERGGDRAGAADAYLSAAHAARDAHGTREALRLYGKALALLQQDSSSRFPAHEAREQILRGLGRRRERRVELEAMRAIAERSGEATLRAVAYERLARYELEEARTAGVEALLRRALDAAIHAGSESAEIEALRLSAHLARELGDIPKALDACDRALVRAGTTTPEQLAARGNVLDLRAELLRRAGRIDSSLEDAAEAFAIFRHLGRKRDEANTLNTLAISLYSRGSWEDSIALLRASIALDRQLGDRFHLGKKLSNIGQLYAELGDAVRAESFLERAVEVQEKLDDRADRADALIGLAELLLSAHGDADVAETTLDLARSIAESTGDHYDLAHERLVRAEIASHRGDTSLAVARLGEAVTEARAAGMLGYELLALAREAEALARLGRADDALDVAEQARGKLARTGTLEREEQVRLALARAYALAGDLDAAEAMRDEGLEVVDAHLATIRDEAMRARYLATATVRALHAPLSEEL